ncbi:hypothetical protein THIOSC13_220042 [uncultured Thiomicrorhabdus sp.]
MVLRRSSHKFCKLEVMHIVCNFYSRYFGRVGKLGKGLWKREADGDSAKVCYLSDYVWLRSTGDISLEQPISVAQNYVALC